MQSEMIGIFERCCIFSLSGLIMANLASLLIFISWHSSSATVCHFEGVGRTPKPPFLRCHTMLSGIISRLFRCCGMSF